MHIRPVLGNGVVDWHAAIVALWVVVDFLNLVPAAGFEVAVVDVVSFEPALGDGDLENVLERLL